MRSPVSLVELMVRQSSNSSRPQDQGTLNALFIATLATNTYRFVDKLPVPVARAVDSLVEREEGSLTSNARRQAVVGQHSALSCKGLDQSEGAKISSDLDLWSFERRRGKD